MMTSRQKGQAPVDAAVDRASSDFRRLSCECVPPHVHKKKYRDASAISFDADTNLHTVLVGEQVVTSDINGLLRSGKLRIKLFPHVLQRLTAFVRTTSSHGLPARSMASNGYG